MVPSGTSFHSLAPLKKLHCVFKKKKTLMRASCKERGDKAGGQSLAQGHFSSSRRTAGAEHRRREAVSRL